MRTTNAVAQVVWMHFFVQGWNWITGRTVRLRLTLNVLGVYFN